MRGLPALLYRGTLGSAQARIAGLLQATSLPFIVAATMIGQQIGVVSRPSSAALVAAGLLSVVIFPATGLALLRRGAGAGASGGTGAEAASPAGPLLSAEDRELAPVPRATFRLRRPTLL